MRNLYKIILAGATAFWAACSNDANSGISGATTEPSTSPTANLTDEQKAILTKSFYSLIDSTKTKIVTNSHMDSLIHVIIEEPIVEIDSETIEILKLSYPFNTKTDTSFYYRSSDNRWKCGVTSFSQESGALLEMFYDSRSFSTSGPGLYFSGNFSTRIVEVDSVPVIMKTVGSADYWGYKISCTEFLEQFKKSCVESNGIFKDFGDGCNASSLNLACSMLIPEDMDVSGAAKKFTDEYLNECKEDSVRYAPYINEDYALRGCQGESGPDEDGILYYYTTCYPIDADPSLDSLSKEWQKSLTRTFDDYREQFDIFKEYKEALYSYSHPELVFGDDRNYSSFVSYNTFPSDISEDLVNAYRKEGVYHLPDSLVATFFPTAANCPTVFKVLERQNETYYMIVLKDVGEKGHVLRNIGDYGIRITDIVKSGDNCPTDTTVHYSAYLVRGAADWDIVEKQITKKTYVSPLWKCDDPESLERIEPYGEWTYQYGFI